MLTLRTGHLVSRFPHLIPVLIRRTVVFPLCMIVVTLSTIALAVMVPICLQPNLNPLQLPSLLILRTVMLIIS